MNNRKITARRNIEKGAASAVQMLAGTALTAVAFGRYIIPQGFAAAGVTGFSSVITAFIPIPLSVTVLLVNVLFLLLGLFFEGKVFALKTVGVSILFPIMLQLFTTGTSPVRSPLFSILAAGMLIGIGTGLLLRSGASSGGFAVAAVILKNRCRIPAAVVLNICDAAVILMQAIHAHLSQTVCGVLVISLSAGMVGAMEAASKRKITVRSTCYKLRYRND